MFKNNETIKFSVILSIYNVENYLERCIKSIINQTYSNLEIILVDDGSVDSCSKICDEWAVRDSRVKVVHKKNEGLGMARNSGFEIATGDYVCFFDSDDYIDTLLFSDVASILENNDTDLIEFGHYRVNNSGKIDKQFIPNLEKKRYINREVKEIFWPELICTDSKTGKASNLIMSAWCAIYRKSCLDNAGFKFVSEREYISEDVYSIMKLMPYIKSVQIMDKAYYFYCMNNASLTHTYKIDRFQKIVDFQKKLVKLCESDEYTDEIRERIQRPFSDNLFSCIKIEVQYLKINGLRATHNKIKNMCNEQQVVLTIKNLPGNSFSLPRKLIHFCIRYKLCWILILIVYVQISLLNRTG